MPPARLSLCHGCDGSSSTATKWHLWRFCPQFCPILLHPWWALGLVMEGGRALCASTAPYLALQIWTGSSTSCESIQRGGESGLEAPSAEQPLGVLLGWEGALRGAQSQHGIPASRRSSCR